MRAAFITHIRGSIYRITLIGLENGDVTYNFESYESAADCIRKWISEGKLN